MSHHPCSLTSVRGAVLLTLLTWPLGVAAADLDTAPRVRAARQHLGQTPQQLFQAKGLGYPPAQLYLRAFKHESQLELWAGPAQQPLVLVKTYPICARSGELGPKRQRGDLQVPEGFYVIDRFNPTSTYHLSLRVSYPNALDRALKTARDPGGDIYIHGSCVTIGCLPLEDGPIEELFVILLDHKAATGRAVPVHIFPTRMDETGMARLQQLADQGSPYQPFWLDLQPAYTLFEKTRRVPSTRPDLVGKKYRVRAGP